ncbi:MAG: thermonuclease family protein [Clostridiaceae bacterium]|nr:thermonuclease family protein [Clostridiaceae bacterium]
MKFKYTILILSIMFITACTISNSSTHTVQPSYDNHQSGKTPSATKVISPTPINKYPEKSKNVVNLQPSPQDLSTSPIKLTEATVTKIVDGDTIYVRIKDKSHKIRLVGINCPEFTKEIEFYGKESTEFTKNQLLNKKVYLEMDVSDKDQYGRLLRYIWLDIPTDINEKEIRTKLFNAILVINGFARAGYYPPDLKYTEYLKDFQQEAKHSKLGLWSSQSKK